MIIEACRCEDGFGVAHNHLVYGHTGQPFPEVQIWVDWKAVARALMKSWRWRSDFDVVPHNDGDPHG